MLLSYIGPCDGVLANRMWAEVICAASMAEETFHGILPLYTLSLSPHLLADAESSGELQGPGEGGDVSKQSAFPVVSN